MKQTHYLLFLLLFSIPLLVAGNTKIDSLKQSLQGKINKEDAATYFWIGDYFNPMNTDSALFYSNKSLNLYRQLEDETGINRCYGLLASIYSELGLSDTAIRLDYKVLLWAENNNKPDMYAFTCLDLGNSYVALDNYQKAKEFYQKAISGTYEPASLAAMANIGLIYLDSNDPDSASYYFLNALAKYYDKDTTDLRVKYNIATLYSNLASAAFQNQKYRKGVDLLKKSLVTSKETGSNILIVGTNIKLGRGYDFLDKYDSAIHHFSIALKIADSTNLIAEKADVFKNLSDHYFKKGEFEKAYSKLSNYYKIKDSLQSVEYESSLAELEMKYELRTKTNKIELLKKINSNLWLSGILIIVIILSLSLIIIGIINRRRLAFKNAKILANLKAETLAIKHLKAETEIKTISQNIIGQNLLIEELETEIHKLTSSSARTDLEEKLFALHKKKILTDNDWIEYFHSFGELYPKFFAILKNLNNLSEGDKQQLIFVKLGFTQKEASYLLGISTEGVKRARQRLAKKLGLLDAGKLKDFVDNECKE